MKGALKGDSTGIKGYRALGIVCPHDTGARPQNWARPTRDGLMVPPGGQGCTAARHLLPRPGPQSAAHAVWAEVGAGEAAGLHVDWCRGPRYHQHPLPTSTLCTQQPSIAPKHCTTLP